MDSIREEFLVTVRELSLSLSGDRKIWKNFTHSFQRGKMYAIVGESGSGKTCFALSLFGILPAHSILRYREFQILGKDWNEIQEREWQNIRGSRVCLIPQNPSLSFHPYRTVGSQVLEFLKWKSRLEWKRKDIMKKWESMGIREPESAYFSLPSQLSGGEKQRISVALADMSGSELIVADEPTSALDPIQTRKVMDLLVRTVLEKNRCLILISHNLPLVMKVSDEVLVVRSGELVEKNMRRDGKFAPWKEEYSKKLWEA